MKCEGIFFSEWAGIRTAATVRVLSQDRKEILTENTGEVQLTDYGISGIPTFQVSHVIGEHLNSLHNTGSVKENGVPLELDFLPDFTEEYLQQQLQTRLRNTVTESLTLANLFMGMVNSKLLACILKQKGLQWEQRISFPDATALLQTLKHFPVNATGLNDFTQAQVTAGGVPLEEIDQNFQSLKVPGFFLCGELLDVDGICGGYNLQWAWTSGWIAGESASTI